MMKNFLKVRYGIPRKVTFCISIISILSLCLLSCSGSKCLLDIQSPEALIGTWNVHFRNEDRGSVDFKSDMTGLSSIKGYFEAVVNYKEAIPKFIWKIESDKNLTLTWTSKGSSASLTNGIDQYTCQKMTLIDQLTGEKVYLERRK